MRYGIFVYVGIVVLMASCSSGKMIGREAKTAIFSNHTLGEAHVGISIYDPAAGKYLYNYQGDKFFVPASNTKIVTCYAAMKHLGDSLPGIQYWSGDKALYLIPTGDPSLLHPDFSRHPVIGFLQQTTKPLFIIDTVWKDNSLGAGWSWGDFNDYYMPERSALPVYGNVLRWFQENNDEINTENPLDYTPFIYSIPEMNWRVRFNADPSKKSFYVQRDRDDNVYTITQGIEKKKEQEVPFVTKNIASALELLPDTIHHDISIAESIPAGHHDLTTVYSQHTDSLLKPMMHRSDNFYAEQVLLMVSQKMLGVMDDSRITDSLLKSDLKDLPQQPRWADGSGLSRYNLFTPQCFVTILDKMQKEFGMDRVKTVFATGGTGTLRNYYQQDSGYIFAKTGTLSGVVSLSGYIYSNKNKLYIFSVLVNNHHGSVTEIRRQVETFLDKLRQQL